MDVKRLKVGKTPLDQSKELSGRCNRSNILVKDESANPFHTFKDRRCAALLEKHSGERSIVFVQITNGNSGYSLGMMAKAKAEETGGNILVVNIVPKGISYKIRETLQECSYVVEMDLGKEVITLDKMREVARSATGFEGPDSQIVNVESFKLEGGYAEIVNEIAEKGVVPNYIFCPVGEGELLVEIAEAAQAVFGEMPPRIIGVTVNENVLVHEKIEEVEGLLKIDSIQKQVADKLVNGYSKFAGIIRRLREGGKVELRVAEEIEIAEADHILKACGIKAEPSAVVAFCGAMAYNALNRRDTVVIINSGKGIYDERNAEIQLESSSIRNYIDSEGNNAIMRAIKRRDFALVKRMFEEKHLEVKSGLFGECVCSRPPSDLLLHQNLDGENALLIAVKYRLPEIAEFLLDIAIERGINSMAFRHRDGSRIIDAHDQSGKGVLYYAIRNKQWGIAKKIAEEMWPVPLPTEEASSSDPLYLACCSGDAEAEKIIPCLLWKRIDGYEEEFLAPVFSVSSHKHEFPLYPASEWASLETLKLLIEAGEREYEYLMARKMEIKKAIDEKNYPEVLRLCKNKRRIRKAIDLKITMGKVISVNDTVLSWLLEELNDAKTEKDVRRIEFRILKLIAAGIPLDRQDWKGRGPLKRVESAGSVLLTDVITQKMGIEGEEREKMLRRVKEASIIRKEGWISPLRQEQE